MSRKNPHSILALCCVFTLTAFSMSLGQSQEVDEGSITGTVYDAQSGNPLRGASIEVTETKQLVQTDMDGKYVIKVPLFGTLVEMDGAYKVYSYAPFD